MVDTKLDYSVIKYSFKWYSFFLFFQVRSHFLNQISLASPISEKDNIYRLLILCSLSSLIAQFTIMAKQTARKRHHLQKQRPLWHLKCIPWTSWVCFVLGICPAKKLHDVSLSVIKKTPLIHLSLSLSHHENNRQSSLWFFLEGFTFSVIFTTVKLRIDILNSLCDFFSLLF